MVTSAHISHVIQSDKKPSIHNVGRFYRPELDAIRFAAFLLVFLHHTVPRHGLIPYLGPQLSGVVTSLANACGFGLCLFFALSAYLITELLIRETDARGKLDIKDFYKRRTLRIWPLYFLGLAIGIAFYFYKPSPGILARYGAYALFIGNFYCATHMGNTGTSPMEMLWSISIEEQFYLFWPWLAAAKIRRLMYVASAVLLVASSVTLAALATRGGPNDLAWFNTCVQFGMFGAGALVSLVLNKGLPQWSAAMRIAGVGSALVLWFIASYTFHIKDAGPFTSRSNLIAGYAFVEIGCALLLLSVLGISATKVPKVFIYLGRISFGLYVYHALALHISGSITHKLGLHEPGITVPLLGLGITVAMAAVSYHFYEKPFLKLKKRVEWVKSAPA